MVKKNYFLQLNKKSKGKKRVRTITILDFCSGGGMTALAIKRAARRLGIRVKIIAYAEIDKFACQAYEKLHGSNVPNMGDITVASYEGMKADMLYTGMRVGEVCGLRWEDLDFEEGVIHVEHTLVYYNHRDENGCYFNVHKTKTRAGTRTIPMLDEVREAFMMEKKYQEFNNLKCNVTIDGYTNFIFINRFGNVQHQGTLNKAIRRIIRDCNDYQMEKGGKNPVLLPKFSCHSLRHTFTTRLVEAGVNIKVVQNVLGHADFSTTMDIYTDVTKELKKREFDDLGEKMKKQKGRKG